ncbi:MAG: hypothetical protein JWM25_1327 [Thermoleophilia bacterium]|nr:hypothetical protein [Thermoleophilia bacterium]
MSELQQPTTRPIAPTQAPGTVTSPSDGAAEVYRRAVEAKPTGFTENPIGAMAQAVDRIGKAAGNVFAGKALEGQDGLAQGEARLKAAIAQMRANPGSVEAKQHALTAGLALLDDMASLAPNDPRRLSVAKFVVGLAGQLGAANLPFGAQGLDVRGVLRVAAQLLSRFGSPADMQAAFNLEGTLKASLPATSPQALAVRDELMQRLGLSQHAKSLIASGWAVRLTNPGEVPTLDLSARTLALDATQHNPSLGVLARAYWQDQSLRSPQEKDGFMEAFQKVANQSSFAVLGRKYREVRDLARREIQQGRIGVLGAPSNTPAGNAGVVTGDEGADMFASLASFAQSGEGGELPGELSSPLQRFYAPA